MISEQQGALQVQGHGPPEFQFGFNLLSSFGKAVSENYLPPRRRGGLWVMNVSIIDCQTIVKIETTEDEGVCPLRGETTSKRVGLLVAICNSEELLLMNI